MTVRELIDGLKSGKTLENLFPIIMGSDDYIGKLNWEDYNKAKLDDIVYIPDVSLNKIIYNEDISMNPCAIENIIINTYTKGEFYEIVNGYANVADELFNLCAWQHPCLIDVVGGYENDDDLMAAFGVTFADLGLNFEDEEE